MQQIILNIDNPKIEAILSDILKQNKIPIDNIISDIIEKYIYLYSVQILTTASVFPIHILSPMFNEKILGVNEPE